MVFPIWSKSEDKNLTFFLYDQKVKTKIWLSCKQKELLRCYNKYLSLFLKGFQLHRVVSDLRVHLIIEWNDCFAIPMEDKFESSESIVLRTSLCSYSVSWKMYLLTCKKSSLWAAQKWFFYSVYFCDGGMKKRCMLWN